jgi:hypothetical protein
MSVRALMKGVVPQTCGVGFSGIFRNLPAGSTQGDAVASMTNVGGCGWHIAGFTMAGENKAAYEEAYKVLKKRWKIIYQSEVRKNTRTKNDFFFVIYDTTKKGE